MIPAIDARGSRRRPLARAQWLLVFALAIALAFHSAPHAASAHAYLARSDPPANAVLAIAPAEAHLWFTEPLEPRYSRAILFDSTGAQLATQPSHLGATPDELVAPLPAGLPRGTYTIQWRNISAADGHPETGFVPFTIGEQSDVVAPITPANLQSGSAPEWLDGTGRWLGLLGMATALGALLTWLLVISPALHGVPEAGVVEARQRLIQLGRIALVLGLLGSLITVAIQTHNAGASVTLNAVVTILHGSRFGRYWLLRVGFMSAFLVLYPSRELWARPPLRWFTIVTLACGAATLLTFAEVSHAAAQEGGRPAAVVNDWLHLSAATAWIGGLLGLAVGLVYGLRRWPADERREIYARAIPRFSTLAISSVVILSLTGLYSAWMQVGNLFALRSTAYGQLLLIKLALVAPMLVLGAVNQRVIGPRMRAAAQSGVHFGRSIAAEALLGVGVFFVVGILTSLPSAREAATPPPGETSFHWNTNGIRATLALSPGIVGLNRYTATIEPEDGALPDDARVLLRIANGGTFEGEREVTLARTGPARYEATGSELSVVGDWQMDLLVRRPNALDWRVHTSTSIGTTTPRVSTNSAPPRFTGAAAGVAVALAGAGIVALFVALRYVRRRAATLGAVLLLIAVVTLGVTRSAGPALDGQAAGSLVQRASTVTTPGAIAVVDTDACGLIEPAQVASLFGAAADSRRLDNPEGIPNCVWIVGDGDSGRTITLRVLTGTPRLDLAQPSEAVSELGLGDTAYWLPWLGDLVVRSGDRGFDIQIQTARATDQLPQADQLLTVARGLAATVLGKLGATSP